MPRIPSAAALPCKAACSTLASGASLTTPTLNVSGGAIAAADATGTLNGSLNYTSSTSSTFIGAITGAGSTLTMNNALASLTLAGTDTYGGQTTVSAGSLVVNGQLTASPVSVQGGLLLGNGQILNTVTLSSGTIGSARRSAATFFLTATVRIPRARSAAGSQCKTVCSRWAAARF